LEKTIKSLESLEDAKVDLKTKSAVQRRVQKEKTGKKIEEEK
jgi:predicted nucleotidyltransferase